MGALAHARSVSDDGAPDEFPVAPSIGCEGVTFCATPILRKRFTIEGRDRAFFLA
jgi:hypothetical protein